MDFENPVANQSFATHTIEDIDANVSLESTFESEKVNEDIVNLTCDEDEAKDLSIMGKVFSTPKDAYTFYNQYAFLHGFGIRVHWSFKNKTTNEPYRKSYVCNKQGFKSLKGNSLCGVAKNRRRNLRTGCKAMLQISKGKDGEWFVDVFNDTHNHNLSTTPTKVMKHRSHGKIHRSMCKSLMVELGQSGLRPCQIKKAVNTMKPPYDANVTSKSPKNVFWADGRSREAYTKFGDVVVFDVTYMTNKFKMPFAPFIGVNHHGQSILFGGALLENEKEETFR
ncbi:protein FAR1-RELATED SEQUENCE 7-like [Lactuca sativa]|uniref:protein FAR1-RELATED SEQUENCE 7-like n=1 Tax=Lactuca sativa TaxID=4236 RepID=UPI000CD9BC24|nr:protein FAR1-RELATED SEQUENCE 7-like [Lactuca sativa]